MPFQNFGLKRGVFVYAICVISPFVWHSPFQSFFSLVLHCVLLAGDLWPDSKFKVSILNFLQPRPR